MEDGEGLLLVAYRIVPLWAVPTSTADPLLPRQVPTMSDHLVDPVPDDETWFASAEAAAALARRAVNTRARVMAMGVHERDADDVVGRRLTLDTDQLCLNEHHEHPGLPDSALSATNSSGSKPAVSTAGSATEGLLPGHTGRSEYSSTPTA